MTVAAVAQMEGISEATLYNGRNQAKSVHGAEKETDQWSAEARFTVLVETATLEICPAMAILGFKTLKEAQVWVDKFTRWYNEEHRHSGIGYATPAERYRGEDRKLLKKRDNLYRQVQKIHSERWSGKTRNWQSKGTVMLNPERKKQAA